MTAAPEDPPAWAQVDRFLDPVVGADAMLDQAARRSAAAGLPAIQVSAAHGKLLMLLVQSLAARRVLEIGTLGGISAIWMARGLGPGGRLVSLELAPRHAEVARANLADAGVADRVDVIVGPALETLVTLAPDPPFDLVFIDADKENTPAYFDAAVRLARAGSLIVVDNTVRGGRILAPSDPNAVAMRQFLTALAGDGRVCATVIQTVGEKGYDGFALARVVAPG